MTRSNLQTHASQMNVAHAMYCHRLTWGQWQGGVGGQPGCQVGQLWPSGDPSSTESIIVKLKGSLRPMKIISRDNHQMTQYPILFNGGQTLARLQSIVTIVCNLPLSRLLKRHMGGLRAKVQFQSPQTTIADRVTAQTALCYKCKNPPRSTWSAMKHINNKTYYS